MNKTKTLIAALALPAALFAVAAHPAAAATATTTTTPTTGAPGGASAPAGYVQLVDDTNRITVTVPNTWTTVDTNPSQNPDGTDQPWILATAGTDLDNFQSTFVDGVLYVAYPFEADPQGLMDQYKLTGGCSDVNDSIPAESSIQPYSDGVFTGLIQVGTGCDSTGNTTWNMVVASPPDNSFTAVLQVQTTDPTALQTVLESFNVVAGASPVTTVPGQTTIPGQTPAPTTTPVITAPVITAAGQTTTPVTQPAPTTVGGPTTSATLTTATLPIGPVEPGAVLITDDTNTIEVSVPATWTDVYTAPITASDGSTAPYIAASTDLNVFLPPQGTADTFTAPGVIYTTIPFTADPQSVLIDRGMGASCTDGGIAPYSDGVFTGFFQTWTNCGGTATRIITLAANPPDSSVTVFLLIQLTTDDDTPLQTVVSSFNFAGAGPAATTTTVAG